MATPQLWAIAEEQRVVPSHHGVVRSNFQRHEVELLCELWFVATPAREEGGVKERERREEKERREKNEGRERVGERGGRREKERGERGDRVRVRRRKKNVTPLTHTHTHTHSLLQKVRIIPQNCRVARRCFARSQIEGLRLVQFPNFLLKARTSHQIIRVTWLRF